MKPAFTFPYLLLASLAIGTAIALAVIGLANQPMPTLTDNLIEETPELVEQPVVSEIPRQKTLKVPFIVQAPNGNWDSIHKEACEEASLLMVYYYKTKLTFSSITEPDKKMVDFINWQTDNSYAYDVTVKQLRQAAADYFEFTGGRIIDNPTVEQIKKEISLGNPIIAPAAGRLLGNPNFIAPGPRYHMLVIIGYDNDEFITNDPGTRNGSSYRYKHAVLMNAIHDFTSGDINKSPKRVLVYD